MQQSRRLNIEKLQHALFVPRHHPIVHALQQAVHLIEVAVGFRQQAVGKQELPTSRAMASVRERSALDWCSTRQQSEIEPNSRPWLSNTGVEQKLHGCSACLKCRSPAVLIGWPCIAASDSAQVPIMLSAQ